MANTGFKGVDVRQTGAELVFRAFLQNSSGALLGTGTTTLSLLEVQSDGSVKSYDFNDNTFKTTALTTPTLALTHRPSNNAGTTTGVWTAALATLTGFTVGAVYLALVNNSGASPTDQCREFQYGSVEGDLLVTAGSTGQAYVQADAIKVNGTTQTARDLGASVLLSPGTGTGQINLYSGNVGVDWSHVTNANATVNLSGTTVSTITTAPDSAGVGTLLTRFTAARAGYMDNLNAGGVLASHADIAALNQSASKHLLLVTVGQYEPGETYTIEMRTFSAADGSAVNADTTPTLTATGQVTGSLAANLSTATNPATGVYRWTYTPGSSPTLEQIRFDGSATISSSAFTLSCYSQTVDMPTAVITATDIAHLTAIYNKLPTNNIADETLVLAAIGTPMQAGTVTLAASQNFNNTGQTTKQAATLSATDFSGVITANATQWGGVGVGGMPLAASAYTAPPSVVAIRQEIDANSTQLAAIDAVLASGVSLNLAQVIPASNTTQTLGDALNAARAQGFGKWVLSGTSLTLYAGDGTTVVRTFTLDSATAPTSRT